MHTFSRALTVITVALVLPLLGGCDDSLVGSPHFEVAHGIVEWQDAPATPVAGSAPPVIQARIEAPDTVQVGEVVNVEVVTLAPSACWREDGAEVSAEGNHVRVTAWDRMEGPPEAPCALLLGELPRQVQVSFPEPGEGVIALRGRRVVGMDDVQDPNTGEEHEIEVTVVVVE